MPDFIAQQNAWLTLPIRLMDATSTVWPKSGISANVLTVWVADSIGVSKHKAMTATCWSEVNAANQPGEYRMLFAPSELAQVGCFSFTIKADGIITLAERFWVEEVKNNDIYTRIGAPAGVSIATDIANVLSAVHAIPTANVSSDVTAIKQAVMGHTELNLQTLVHTIFNADGSVLQKADVNDTVTTRSYTPQ